MTDLQLFSLFFLVFVLGWALGRAEEYSRLIKILRRAHEDVEAKKAKEI